MASSSSSTASADQGSGLRQKLGKLALEEQRKLSSEERVSLSERETALHGAEVEVERMDTPPTDSSADEHVDEQHFDKRDMATGSEATSAITFRVTSPSGETASYTMWSTQTVGDIQRAFAEAQGVPVDEQIIIFAGRQLQFDPSRTLGKCGIWQNSSLRVILTIPLG